jgi:APA family basic amino acid/polyamine antiporter
MTSSTATLAPPGTKLKGQIGPLQLFALGFGSIIGSAWVIILDQWLGSGPGAAVAGFLAGGLVILAIGACYAELTTRIPATGGEFVFALHVYGRRVAFFVGWFIALSWICVTVFEGLALSWFIEKLAPRLGDVVVYQAFGAAVTRNQLIMGAIGALIIARINYLGGSAAARFQGILTYGFLTLALLILGDLLLHGHRDNLLPLFPTGGSTPWWLGAASVFASCAFLLNGFQAVSQAVEERSARVSLTAVAAIMMSAIIAGSLFYCLVVVAASSAAPWEQLAHTNLAILSATSSLPGGQFLAVVLLLAATASLLKTWNVVFLVAARILLALARERLIPAWLGQVDRKTGAPTHAVLVVGACNLLGLFLGRGAISVLVDTNATSVVFCFFLCCIAVPILRRRNDTTAAYRVPGGPWIVGLAILGSILMAGAALVTPFMREDGVPLEYILLACWAAIGAALWLWETHGQRKSEPVPSSAAAEDIPDFSPGGPGARSVDPSDRR